MEAEARASFSLMWRWTRATHAQFSAAELASLRPLPANDAAALCDKAINDRAHLQPGERLEVDDDTETQAVTKWLDEVIPPDACELCLVWDRGTAIRLPRDLFIRRWDDFWYPSSDDLSVLTTDDQWQLEMCHWGSFEISKRATDLE